MSATHHIDRVGSKVMAEYVAADDACHALGIPPDELEAKVRALVVAARGFVKESRLGLLGRLRASEHQRSKHPDIADYCTKEPCASITEALGKRALLKAALAPFEGVTG